MVTATGSDHVSVVAPTTATGTAHVSVHAVNSATGMAHVSVQSFTTATGTAHVSVTVAGTLVLTPDLTYVNAGQTVTLFASGGTPSGWSADHGVTIVGSGTTRTFVAPEFVDTTVVTVTITGTGGPATCQVTVEGQPSIFRGSAWVPTWVFRGA